MTTHQKCAEDTLCARYMPKNVPKPSSNWGIKVSEHNPATSKLVYHPDRTVRKIKIRMRDAQFEDGRPQPLYYPMDDPNPDLQGVFKGMEVILQEWGFMDSDSHNSKGKKLFAQCNKFKCTPGETKCCMHWILYNQPDFAQAEFLLETLCQGQGVEVIFLPKFHHELNFIEQCTKSVYQTYLPSLCEEDLENNTLKMHAEVPIHMIRKFSIQSQ